MKSRALRLFAVLLLSASAFAASPECKKVPPPPPPPVQPKPPAPTPPPAPAPVTNTNTNTNTNTATSSASSNQSQGQQQSQSATASGGSASNGNQSMSSNYQQVRQAPPAYAPTVLPTANCLGGYSAGGSAPVGGISFGGSKVDKECRMQALANEFLAMGNFEAAAKVLCATKSAKEAKLTIEDCRLAVAPAPVVVERLAPAPLPQVTVVQQPTPAPTPVVSTPVTKPAVKKAAHRKPCSEPTAQQLLKLSKQLRDEEARQRLEK